MGGTRDGLRDRREAARSLHLQCPLPVLDRRGPRRRQMRLSPRVAHRRRLDRGRRCGGPDRRPVRPHPGQRPGRRSPGRRRSSSTTGRPTSSRPSLLKVFTGQLGGAIADLAGLIGEVVVGRTRPDHVHRRWRPRASHRRRPSPMPRSRRSRARPATRRSCPRRSSRRSRGRRSSPERPTTSRVTAIPMACPT